MYRAALATGLLGLASNVAAHGYVASITVNGQTYPGANPSNIYQVPFPEVAGWTADNIDNGFVAPSQYQDPAIICHREATPGLASIPVSPGDTLTLTWSTWPESHHGPVLDYLAHVNGDFASIDKTQLSFVKIDAEGLLSGYNPGTWATDDLIADAFSWDVTLPSNLASGNYVLRHEIIALHSAGNPGGAQNYPQCINLQVSGGSGGAVPSGQPATSFYTPNDPGILFDLYRSFSSYPIPGPAVWTG